MSKIGCRENTACLAPQDGRSIHAVIGRLISACCFFPHPRNFAHGARKSISLTDTTPFGTKDFKIPFDATGKKWVRFSVWDSAGKGAYVQPIQLKE